MALAVLHRLRIRPHTDQPRRYRSGEHPRRTLRRHFGGVDAVVGTSEAAELPTESERSPNKGECGVRRHNGTLLRLEMLRQDVPDVVLEKSKHKKAERSAIMASRALKIDPKKSGTCQPTDSTERNVSEAVSEDAITALAYQLWQERGCPIGSGQQDWFQAEHELKALKVSIPTAA